MLDHNLIRFLVIGIIVTDIVDAIVEHGNCMDACTFSIRRSGVPHSSDTIIHTIVVICFLCIQMYLRKIVIYQM